MKKMKILFTALVCLVATLAASAQNIDVRGTVKDAAGNPVVGAGIVLRGNNRVYTMSDAAGSFHLSVPQDGALVVTCLGYQEQTVSVGGRRVIDIVLVDDRDRKSVV